MESLLMGSKGPIHRNRHTGSYYPWDEWFDRARLSTVILKRGVDYLCMDHGMASQIRDKAARRDLVVTVTLEEGRVLFTVTGERG